MGIHEELAAELKDAMRSKDRRRLDVIRSVETEVSTARSAPGHRAGDPDELYLRVIASYVKRMEKARQEYLDLGDRGREQAEKLAFEVDYLRRWLPTTLDEEQTRAIVRGVISELGADDPGMAGRVIGGVMKAGHEGLDGAMVNRIVREELGAG